MLAGTEQTETRNRAESLRVSQVDALLHPRSIAIVGASPKPGGWTAPIAGNLQRFGFSGPIYGINPNYQECLGLPCFPDIAALPEAADQLVFLIPAERVPPVILEAGKRGTRSAVIVSGGFAADSTQSEALAGALRSAVEATGMAVCGPNCMGNISVADRVVTLADTRFARLDAGPVAIVSQSGGILTALCRALIDRDTGFSYLVSSGNQIGLDVADYLAYLAECPTTRVIALFIEGLPRSRAFLDACRLCSEKGKAIIALKVGGSAAAREGAATHTGVLAGALSVFRGAVAGLDVTMVDTLDQMIEVIELYKTTGRPKRPHAGIATVTFSGGMRNLVLDAAERRALPHPPFSPQTCEVLARYIPPPYVANPLDSGVLGILPRDSYRDCIAAILRDPAIDLLLVQEELPRAPGQSDKEENLRNLSALAEASGKPIAALSMLSHNVTDHGRSVRQSAPAVAFLQDIDKALLAVGKWRERHLAAPASADRPPPPRTGYWQERLRRPGASALDEAESKQLLADFGLPAPRESVCATLAEARAAADRIGYPVALKIVSPDILHKTEVGGVVLGIATPAALDAAHGRMLAAVAERAPQARIAGLLVAEMVGGGLEFALGLHRDPEFGLALMLGAGGLLVEFLSDATFRLPPLDRDSAAAMIGELRMAQLLGGVRGGPPFDHAALAEALVALSDLALHLGEAIESLDINPLLLLPDRGGCRILDAVVVPRKALAKGSRP